MTLNRFLTGSLASIAVASAVTLAAPAAHAADRGCGQPATDAVYTSVERPAVFRTVPAQTHLEWLWERDVAVFSSEFTKVVSPASVETDWSRQVPGPTEYLFTRTVVDVPEVPAVPGTPEVGHFETVVTTPAVLVTEWEYQHENTGKLRWESETWGAQNGQGNGWEKTGSTRQTEVTPAVTTQVWVVDSPATPGTPAVPAVTHTESLWAQTSPGSDWVGPLDSQVGQGSTEQTTTTGDVPAGDGWELVATREIPAVVDTVWAETAPEGYTPTGATEVAGSLHEVTAARSAAAPAGDGWSQVADSATEVVDVPETQELVTPAFTEQVLVSPALPATEPCVAAPGTEEPGTEIPQGVPAPADAVSSPSTVLPETGNGVPLWMAPTGVAAMLAGIAVIRFSRRPGVR